MPFDHGSVNATFFTFENDLPNNFLECLHSRRAGSLDSVTDEIQTGWVSGRHLLDNRIEEDNAHRGEFYHIALRNASRKIPTAYLNALCKQEEDVYIKANNLEWVPRKVKKSIKEDIVEKNLMKMPPSLSGIPIVISPVEKLMFVGASSEAQIDLFIENFLKCTAIEPLQFTPVMLLAKKDTNETALPKISFAENKEDEPCIGRDFLTWLWFYSETEGKIEHEQFGSFDIMIEGPLTFAYASESQGAGETVLKKGDFPQRSAEAKAALLSGKKLKKAKVTITRNGDAWSGNFDADKFAFGSLNLPDGEAQDDEGRFEERMQSLVVLEQALETYFNFFADKLSASDFNEYQTKIQKWALDREEI